MKSVDPKSNILIKEYNRMHQGQVDAMISQSNVAWRSWRMAPLPERSALMTQLAHVLLKDKSKYAYLITKEMGKILDESMAEVEKCAKVCAYYAENSAQLLETTDITTEARMSAVSHQPLGIVLGVMPWNFPFWQVFRFAVPTLMAGNTCLLKHAPNVSGCSLAIESAFRSAGFPIHVFKSLLIDEEDVGRIIENPYIQAVSLTGSTRAGRSVARKCGEMLKKTVLELGGSDPYIILADADLEHAVKTCVKSRMLNAGQSCIAAKRFIVENSIYEEFKEHFTEQMMAYRYGDPLTDVDMGPLARVDLRDHLHEQVQKSIDLGARSLTGGAIPADDGAYYPPTVLEEIAPAMPAYDEELFGPVASLMSAADERQAIAMANETRYGLGAAIFTQDIEKGEHIAEEELQAGNCFVNEMVHSDPRLPFGGIKNSGYGRELGPVGIKEFVNRKTVYVK